MNVHFISIGGSVMHQLAIALKRKGYQVTGSDDDIFEPAQSNLEKEGILPDKIGWFEDNINSSLNAIILGMHAKADNPEILKAKELGLPIYSFPEYIFKESINKMRVVIGGSHGKTTTTAMIMHVLRDVGKEFDYLVGAKLQGFELSVSITDAPYLICEGDEYPASVVDKRPKFHFLFPHIAVITGIAWDHINVFPTFDEYVDQFKIFIDKIETGGQVIYNDTDEKLKKIIQKNTRSDIYYKPYNVLQHSKDNSKTTISIEGSESTIQVFGQHNLLNMHAAWLVCQQLNVSAAQFSKSIASFTGASKRLELLAQNENVIVYRDFAHAPSKVKATLQAVRQQFSGKKLFAVLELHTYSSLNKEFMKEYDGVLDDANEAVVFYSKHALEIKKMPELSPDAIKQGFNNDRLKVITNKPELEEWLDYQDFSNSVVLFMSSGTYEGLDLESFSKRMTQLAN
jgi:UDP-N-acetylmuramate: L-alanyl-gamma-D-glutamyl-meso-diaminopimelate ligase